MATAVFVVVLGFCYRVVNVDRGHFKLACRQHFIEAVHACCRLLGDAVNLLEHFRVLAVDHFGQVAAVVKDHIGVPGFTVLEYGLLNAPEKLFLCFTFPRVHRDPASRHGRGGMILG